MTVTTALRTRAPALAAAVALASLCCSCALEVEDKPLTNLVGSVGIDVSVVNGKLDTRSGALELLEPGRSYYIDQLRLQVTQYDYPATDVLAWIKKYSQFSGLDWSNLTPVETESESEDGKTYEEVRYYQGADWMVDEHTFAIHFFDDKGKKIEGVPGVKLRAEGFAIARHVASVWAKGQVGKRDDGKNSGDYSAVTITSGGTYKGSKEDLYEIEVSKAGTLDDGDLEVTVTSVRGEGDASKGITVSNGVAVPLGTQGATITFTDPLASSVAFTKGDRWIVRTYPDGGKVCTADKDCVGPCKLPPPKPGPPGPPAKGSCVGVAPVAEGIQSRYGAMAEIRFSVAERLSDVFTLPANTRKLRVTWNDGDSARAFDFDVTFARDASGKPLGKGPAPSADYGLETRIVVPTPKNKRFFDLASKADREFTITFDLLDSKGTSLLADGEDKQGNKVKLLPTYYDYITGKSKGLQYYNTGLKHPSGHGFFDDHRLNLAEGIVVGPKHLLEQDYTVDQKDKKWFKTTAQYPPPAMIFSAFSDPDKKNWKIPMTATIPVKLPATAPPGTYIAMVKMARDYYGEERYDMELVEFQVGTSTRTEFNKGTGNCDVCHTGDVALSRLRHGGKGMEDGFTCVVCHMRPHTEVAPNVVHKSHLYSLNFNTQKNDCTLCHLLPGSNTRASQKVCGGCHGHAHEDQPELQKADPYAFCGRTCHRRQSAGHVKLPPL